VNPEALTPWKAEMLWQLYAATENYLNRSVDDQRLYVAERTPSNSSISCRPDKKGPKRSDSGIFWTVFRSDICSLTLRRKSRLTTGCINVWTLFGGNQRHQARRLLRACLVTTDRPFLLRKVAGTISSWGMNILKADACANKAGTVLDILRFSDRSTPSITIRPRLFA